MKLKPIYLTSMEMTAAVQELEGERLPTRTLATWAERGVLVPSVDWAKTRRSTRLYSLRDLARLRLIVRLRRKSVSMIKVRLIMQHLEQYEGDVFRIGSTAALVVDGWRAEVVLQRDGELARSVPTGQLFLSFADVTEGNREAAERAKRAA